MDRIPSSPPHIAPLPSYTHRPLWSVMIPAYNCGKYLEECINSVLSQCPDADSMQIEVIDDHSTDIDVKALVERTGKGRVGYFRQPKNAGSIRNFETCINRARGHLIHILHGDDLVKPGFYSELQQLFDRYPDAGAAFADFVYVDEQSQLLYTESPLLQEAGILHDALDILGERQRIQPPSMVVKRQVYEKLGSFFAVTYGEDWEMWTRIAANYPILHSPKQLACYRVHHSNISGSALSTGQNIRDINKVMDIIQHYLPAEKRKKLRKKAERNFSEYYAWVAHKMYHEQKNIPAALKQANGALLLNRNRSTIWLALKLYAKIIIRYKQ